MDVIQNKHSLGNGGGDSRMAPIATRTLQWQLGDIGSAFVLDAGEGITFWLCRAKAAPHCSEITDLQVLPWDELDPADEQPWQRYQYHHHFEPDL